MEGKIIKIERYTVHNGPGIRTTVFLKGCPLKCWWCSNPESQKFHNEIMVNDNICLGMDKCKLCIEVCNIRAIQRNVINNKITIDRNLCNNCGECTKVCPTKALFLVGMKLNVQDTLSELLKDIPFYESSRGGVTISGGEPLSQPEFVFNLLKKCKDHKLHTVLDTSGYGEWGDLKKILKYTDLVLYDLKFIDSKKHKKYTGVNNDIILKNVEKIAKYKADCLVIRLPLIPSINDSGGDINKLLNFLKAISFKKIEILPYHRLGISKYEMLGEIYQLKNIQLFSKEKINSIKLLIKAEGFNVEVIN